MPIAQRARQVSKRLDPQEFSEVRNRLCLPRRLRVSRSISDRVQAMIRFRSGFVARLEAASLWPVVGAVDGEKSTPRPPRRRRPFRSCFRSVAAWTMLMGTGITQPALAQTCNPFEYLFGACSGSTQAQAPVARSAKAPGKARRFGLAARRKARPLAAEGYKQWALAPAAGVATGSLAHFSADPTLKPGDLVVTPKGLLMYRGSGGDGVAFGPVSRRADLIEIERSTRSTTPVSWSTSAPRLSQVPGLLVGLAPPGSTSGEGTR